MHVFLLVWFFFFNPFSNEENLPHYSHWRQLPNEQKWSTFMAPIPESQFLSNLSTSFHPTEADLVEATITYPSDLGRSL